jgi:hypothetical protein
MPDPRRFYEGYDPEPEWPRYDPSDRYDVPDDSEPDREPEDDLDPLTERLTWDYDFIADRNTVDKP